MANYGNHKCDECEKEFPLTRGKRETVRNGGKSFCSRKCLSLFYTSRVAVDCDQCGKSVSKTPAEISGLHNFCSRSCSVTFNNSKNPKRKRDLGEIREVKKRKPRLPAKKDCLCGAKIGVRSKSCLDCTRNKTDSQTLGSIILSYKSFGDYARHRAFSRIRANARIRHKGAESSGCSNCGWIHQTQLHHIREISDFPDSATMKDINSTENVLILCGNCHGYIHKFGQLPDPSISYGQH